MMMVGLSYASVATRTEAGQLRRGTKQTSQTGGQYHLANWSPCLSSSKVLSDGCLKLHKAEINTILYIMMLQIVKSKPLIYSMFNFSLIFMAASSFVRYRYTYGRMIGCTASSFASFCT